MYKEKEVRIHIDDIKAFRKKLKELGAVLVRRYSCIDYVCEPRKKHWNPHFVNLKIRHQVTGDRAGVIEMSLHKVRWTKGVKITTLGFKAVLEIPKSRIKDFIDLMDFQKLTTYSRKGEHYQIGDYHFTLEKINHGGYLLEIETETMKRLQKTLKLLGEKNHIVKKSVPELVLEKLNSK